MRNAGEQESILSCLSEEEHWCKKAFGSYKPHELHYLTSTRLLFTQNGPRFKQKLDGSLETMGREDENDEEEKEKKTQLHEVVKEEKEKQTEKLSSALLF